MAERHDDSSRISRETRAEAHRVDRKVKIGLLAVSCLTIVLLMSAALGENIFAGWRKIRSEYARILKAHSSDELGRSVARAFHLEVDQNVILEANIVDRCITCHTGVDDPRMAEQQQPYATHPGRYVQVHQPTQFGCTVCHEGQGRATSAAAAHGRVPFWDYPLLEAPYMKSGCRKCHSHEQLYGAERMIDALDGEASGAASSSRLDRGWRLMEDNGCLGCHAIDGRGGNLGQELTRVGEKTPHQFSFAHLEHDGLRSVAAWLEEHFLDPKRVSPGTLMPNMGLDRDDAEALTAVMLSLRTDGPGSLRHALRSDPGTRSGGKLYALYCSSCHGDDGAASEVPEIRTPSLNNDDALAVVDDDYMRQIISTGRSGTHMPAWGAGRGNLTQGEIDRIIGFIRGWEAGAAHPSEARSELGDPEVGRVYFHSLCANCHGETGGGGIGNSLNSPSFLSIAPDRFLAETIINGRPGTAMPSWKSLPAQGVSDILAYIRLWQTQPPSFESVRREMNRSSRRDLAREGRAHYRLHCASCHGREGEGGIGLTLNTQDLLRVVDDRFLYRTIVEGRPATAMPAWYHLPARQIAAIITYLRSWQRGGPVAARMPVPPGEHITGEVHYRNACGSCHGEKGGGAIGPNLTNRVLLDTLTDGQLFRWIARGRAGTPMKGFAAAEQGPIALNDTQIADVIAYLRYAARGEEIPLRRLGEGDPSVGAQLFAGSCASCHGGHGEGASGPQLNNPSFLASVSDGFLAATMVIGREGTPMRSMVHGQQGLGQIPPEQVQDVIAFIRLWDDPGVWRRPRPSVEMSDRAIGAGRELFAGYCSGCHGPTGRGARDGPDYYAPALNNPEFLAAASDGFLLATIARGRRGTPMRPFGKGAGGIVSLEPDDINDIVSYLRSWQYGPTLAGGVIP